LRSMYTWTISAELPITAWSFPFFPGHIHLVCSMAVYVHIRPSCSRGGQDRIRFSISIRLSNYQAQQCYWNHKHYDIWYRLGIDEPLETKKAI
jgi:hypothetical protein